MSYRVFVRNMRIMNDILKDATKAYEKEDWARFNELDAEFQWYHRTHGAGARMITFGDIWKHQEDQKPGTHPLIAHILEKFKPIA